METMVNIFLKLFQKKEESTTKRCLKVPSVEGSFSVVGKYLVPDDVDNMYESFGRTRQTLWSAVQMLTQKLCCQTIHDCPKVVPLHYESE